ncbi:MAG TPA: substrate-binding domain-containing protein [Burkholderiales bacterium]|jgi:molybdate transport repressor ModE-like protein
MPHPFDVDLRTVWRFRRAGQPELDLTLLDLLDAIERSGKLTVAARAARISHRHAWNLIEKWSDFFGAPLVTIERGRGTRLSALGAKLLWAGKRAHARLGPELDNLAAELASSLNGAVAASTPTLRVHASHDFSLSKLRELASKTRSIGIDLRYRGSAEALASLRRGACDVAGFHVTDGLLGRPAATRYAEALGPAVHRLVWVATRVQGLIVAKGNPKSIGSVADLARPGVRFINRQRDSGTRMLVDELFTSAAIDPARVEGYENEEHTHAAVAAHVASGLADAGLGIKAASVQFGLSFVPLATERYFFAVHKDLLEQREGKLLIGLLRGDAFHDAVAALHGVGAHRTGEISLVDRTPPWDDLL